MSRSASPEPATVDAGSANGYPGPGPDVHVESHFDADAHAHFDVDPDFVARLQVALGRTARLLRETAAGELTPTQLAVLSALLRGGPRRLTELAEVERINPTMLSRVIGRLEQLQLVRRSAQPDRRAYLLSITDEGQALAEGIRRDRCAALAKRLARLDPAKAAALLQALPALESLAEDFAAERKR